MNCDVALFFFKKLSARCFHWVFLTYKIHERFRVRRKLVVATLASLNPSMVEYEIKIDNLLASNGWKCGLSIATILKGM